MTRDMTLGSPLSRILSFCAPLLVGNLLQQLYGLADSIIVGRLLGVDAFAAVGSTGALNFLVLGFALGICSGFAIPISQSFGAGDRDAVRRRAGQVVWLGLLFSVLLTVLTFFTTRRILELTSTPADIFEDAYRYIFIVFMGAGATMLYNLTSGVLRALGDSRTPLLFLIAAVAVNVVLDLTLIAGVGMGVEGAAYATVASQAASGLACLIYIRLRVPMLRLRWADLRPDWRELGHIAGIGVPMGLQFSITAVGTKLDRVRTGVRDITFVSVAYSLAALAVNWFFSMAISRLFLDASETAILHDVRTYLTVNGAAYPLLTIILVFRNSLQGLGFSNSAMLAGLAELVGRAIVAFGLVGSFGFAAVCIANPVAWLFADAILLPLYFSKLRLLECGRAWRLRRARSTRLA